jgi:large subunit ribosomal protein L33
MGWGVHVAPHLPLSPQSSVLSPEATEGSIAVAKRKADRTIVTLECTGCSNRNYTTEKNKRNDPQRMELKKYCPRERKVTLHRETR